MTEPFNPTSPAAFECAVTAMRRYCWCLALLEMGGDDGPWFATCSYCWAVRQQDREDYQIRRDWFGDAYPGGPVTPTARVGCAEHGIDHPHLHCRESQR